MPNKFHSFPIFGDLSVLSFFQLRPHGIIRVIPPHLDLNLHFIKLPEGKKAIGELKMGQ